MLVAIGLIVVAIVVAAGEDLTVDVVNAIHQICSWSAVAVIHQISSCSAVVDNFGKAFFDAAVAMH